MHGTGVGGGGVGGVGGAGVGGVGGVGGRGAHVALHLCFAHVGTHSFDVPFDANGLPMRPQV